MFRFCAALVLCIVSCLVQRSLFVQCKFFALCVCAKLPVVLSLFSFVFGDVIYIRHPSTYFYMQRKCCSQKIFNMDGLCTFHLLQPLRAFCFEVVASVGLVMLGILVADPSRSVPSHSTRLQLLELRPSPRMN